MNHLIITADDFGLAEAINEAVELAHRCGTLSAASLMVSGPAAADALRRARMLPNLRVGLHVVLVEGAPTLSPEQIPGLVDGDGRLRSDLGRFGLDLVSRPALRRQMRTEIAAQFEAYRATGLPLDHVDVHKHFHLHPVVGAQIIAVGRRFGMRALRVPAEPQAVLAQIETNSGGASARLLTPFVALLRARARRAGLLTPDAVFGLQWTGALTTERLLGLLQQLPNGLIEIYTHPATSDHFPGHAQGYRYAGELAALRAPEVAAALRASQHRLGSYGDAFGSPGK